MNLIRPAVIFCTLILCGINSLGQQRRSIQRIDSKIVFDGIPDEAAWDRIDTFPMISHTPVFGMPPSERSVVKMGYDDEYVYVGGLLYVSDPGYIQAIGKKRDMISFSSDFFGISIDSYNDKENSLLFFTNPLGFRWDATVRNDGTPLGEEVPVNNSWNTFWDVKTFMDDQGWYLELRIPISSLRFQ